MAITIANTRRATYRDKYATITLDNSYPTGGYAVTAKQFGLGRNIVQLQAFASGGYSAEYVPSTGKIKIYRGDNTNAAAAPSVEVANGVDLSAVTVRVRVTGF